MQGKNLSSQPELGFPCGSVDKESACNAETWVQSLGWEDPLVLEGNGKPLQYSSLENPVDGGVWQATVQEVTESDMMSD